MTTTSTAVSSRIAHVPTALAESPAATVARRAPFTAPAEEIGETSGRLEGSIPSWVQGTLLRVAPSFGARSDWAPAHWFDALALAGAFDIGGGSDEVRLRWSLIESDVARAATKPRMATSHFSTPNGRGFFERLISPVPRISDNTNVNIVKMGKEIVALTESRHQWLLDPMNLRAAARAKYADEIGRDAVMLAHPVIERGVVTNLAYTFGRKAEVFLYGHPATSEGARARKVLARWSTTELPYIHSFGLTDRTAVIINHPLRVRPTSLLWSNAGFIDHFKWQPEQGTKLVVLDRRTGAVEEYETDPFFTFHVAQTFESESGDTLTIDLLAYEDTAIVRNLTTLALAREIPSIEARLVRLVVDRKTKKVERRDLSATGFEFPHLDFALARGRSAATIYGASFATRAGKTQNAVVAVDTETGNALRFNDEGYLFGEPVFVGKPGRTQEGDGVLLVVGSAETTSALFVLDAKTLEPVAKACFGVPFPLGFHGSFARG